MNVTVFSNVLVIVGYILSKFSPDELNPLFSGNVLILFGHLAAMLSDAYNVFEDLYIITNCGSISVNCYYVFANIFSALGEYHDLKSNIESKE